MNRPGGPFRPGTPSPRTPARHVEHKQTLLAQAIRLTDHVSAIADAITGVGLRAATIRPKQSGVRGQWSHR